MIRDVMPMGDAIAVEKNEHIAPRLPESGVEDAAFAESLVLLPDMLDPERRPFFEIFDDRFRLRARAVIADQHFEVLGALALERRADERQVPRQLMSGDEERSAREKRRRAHGDSFIPDDPVAFVFKEADAGDFLKAVERDFLEVLPLPFGASAFEIPVPILPPDPLLHDRGMGAFEFF